MKRLLIVSICFLTAAHCLAAAPTQKVRTIENTPGLPTAPLQRVVSPKFFKSLRISPLEGWIVVRANLVTNQMTNCKIVHSELNGAFDTMALEIAKTFAVNPGGLETGSNVPSHTVLVHLLIYKTADGMMAVSFAHLDDPGGNQLFYYGHAVIAVYKNNKWTLIKPNG